ncbi:MAG: hypothetical protein JNL01_13740 [Bdellovibrionales bacterium]|nr:hypothetical protein [Bdellovibrionales bacterium]
MKNNVLLSAFLALMVFGCAGKKENLDLVHLESEQAKAKAAKPSPAYLVQSVPEELTVALPNLALAQDTWIKLISASKSSIDIEQMYVSMQTGEALDPVFTALQAAANRGVKIRMILSKNMITSDPAGLAQMKTIKNIEIGVLDLKAMTGGIQHAKFWIFDHSKIFVGSQNFDWKALSQIHELGVVVEDPTTTQRLDTIFATDWEMAKTGKQPKTFLSAQTILSDPTIDMSSSPAVLNPQGMPATIDVILGQIKSAKKSLQIQVMDYNTSSSSTGSAWTEIDDALVDAAKRGVKVQLLVSHWNTTSHAIGAIKALQGKNGIEVRICTLPEHSKGFISYARVIHSKYMVIDSTRLWMGTSNWSRGYFYATRNTDFLFDRQAMADEASQVFDVLWNAPFTEAVDANKAYPEPRKGS